MDVENSEIGTGSSLSIIQYFLLIWHWAWLVILITIVAACAMYWFSSHQTPIYEAKTQLLVSDPPGTQTVSSSSLVATTNSASTYSEMITDTPVLKKVIADIPLSISPEALQSAISVSIVPNTQIIEVSVRDPSPNIASEIANKLVEEFQVTIQGIQALRYQNSRDGRITIINNLATQQAIEVDPAKKDEIKTSIAQAQTSLNQIIIAEAQSSTIVIQVQPAYPPTFPIGPRTFFNTLMAAIIAAIFTIGGILFIDFLDDSIKNPDESYTKFRIPVLGFISSHKTEDGKPISISEPRNPISESFRSLRTNIQYASVDERVRTIIVTSPTPQEGKTTVSVNLAIVLAQSGRKVILIDGDMRRPQIHSRLNLPNRNGLSGLFVSSLDNLQNSIEETGIENLSAITSGRIPPNPSELLSSQKMKQIIEELLKTYDVIIIDTPPVLTVTDSVALSTMVDRVLLVVKPGKTKRVAYKQTVEQLKRVGAIILGTVMNDIEPRSTRYGIYYHQNSYYYDQTIHEKKKKKPELPAEIKEEG